MYRKIEIIIITLFVFFLFLAEPSMIGSMTQTENEKLAELTERFDSWQGKMEAENVALKADVKEWKSQVENLTKKLQSRENETPEPSCLSSGKPNPSLTRNNRQNMSTKDAKVSCESLRNSGHFADGIYLVEHPTESKKIEVVSCQFESARNTNGDLIGTLTLDPIDLLERKIVHFHVQRNTEFTGEDTVITFESQKFNYGKAMNLTSGVFTAPVTGIYHFAFSGMTKDFLKIIVKVNDNENAASTTTDLKFTLQTNCISLSLVTSLHLNKNDEVRLYKSGVGTICSESDAGLPSTQFSGWLVDEMQ